MTVGVVVSRADEASVLIGDELLAARDWRGVTDDDLTVAGRGSRRYRSNGFELRVVDVRHLDLTDAASLFDDPDLVVFASRHAGETGPLLTAHHTGNLGAADHGGDPRSLAAAAPNALRTVRAALASHAPPAYDVGVEATHHGPSDVGAPSLFVELGSAPVQWRHRAGARAVARAILALEDVQPLAPAADGRRRHVAGFGGGHYAPRFDRILRETDWAVGHVAPDWALEALGDPDANRDVIAQVCDRTPASCALVSGDRPALETVLGDLGYRVVSETWLRATVGVPLPMVRALEQRLGSVDAGLRFGDAARVGDDAASGGPADRPAGAVPETRTDVSFETEPVVVDPDPDLLQTTRGVDAEATRSAVEAAALAFGTAENGTRVTGPVALPEASAWIRVVESLATILRREYDDVTVTAEQVIARRTRFDPDLARDLGVPEGPAFGRLDAGESVEVDGRTVTPADVTTERERRFPIRPGH